MREMRDKGIALRAIADTMKATACRQPCGSEETSSQQPVARRQADGPHLLYRHPRVGTPEASQAVGPPFWPGAGHTNVYAVAGPYVPRPSPRGGPGGRRGAGMDDDYT